MGVTVDLSDVLDGIEALEEHLENPIPLMRKFAPGYRDAVRAVLAAGGAGAVPYAESTRKRMEATGTSQITARGTVRSDRIKRTAGMIKKHAKKLDAEGWSPEWQAKQDKLTRRLEGYAKAESRAERAKVRRKKLEAEVAEKLAAVNKPGFREKEIAAWEKAAKKLQRASASKLGKRKSEDRTPLQHMGKTVTSQIKTEGGSPVLIIFSKAQVVGKVQDEGGAVGHNATLPKRAYIVTPDFDAQVERLRSMLEVDLEEAFNGS